MTCPDGFVPFDTVVLIVSTVGFALFALGALFGRSLTRKD